MQLHAKLGAKSASLSLSDDGSATVGDLHEAIEAAFELPPQTALRILIKGKALKAEDSSTALKDVGIAADMKIMVMASRAAEVKDVKEAKPERMRGFEDDDLRTRTGSSSSSGSNSGAYRAASSASSTPYRFHALAALPVLPPGAAPPTAAASELLRSLASDPGILDIMKRHKYTVGRLSEMPPEGLVGVSSSCTMGLNKNKGEEILLRLRTDDWQGLRPYASLIPVLLHELTHNVHSDHDNSFKQLCSELTKEYRAFHAVRSAGRSTNGGAELAPARAATASSSAAAAADEGHVLGGDGSVLGADAAARGGQSLSAAEAAARAAAARFNVRAAAAAPAPAVASITRAGVSSAMAFAMDLEPCACGACDVCVECIEEPVAVSE